MGSNNEILPQAFELSDPEGNDTWWWAERQSVQLTREVGARPGTPLRAGPQWEPRAQPLCGGHPGVNPKACCAESQEHSLYGGTGSPMSVSPEQLLSAGELSLCPLCHFLRSTCSPGSSRNGFIRIKGYVGNPAR